MTDNKISKAPPPISPLVSSPLKPSKFDTNVKGSPNWKHWRHVSTIEIWQGLLLSLNVEPPGNGRLLDNKPGATGDIPYEYLDNHGLTDEFKRRWCLIINRLETRYAAAGIPPKVELTNFLGLPLFAALAVEFEWEDLPSELVEIAQNQHDKSGVPSAKDEALNTTDSLTPKRKRSNTLAEEYEPMLIENPKLTATQLMAQLIRRIGQQDTCIMCATGDGLQWDEYNGKDQQKLTIKKLENRIMRWRKKHKTRS